MRNSLQRIGRVYGWNERPLPSITDDDAAAMLQDIAERAARRPWQIKPSTSCHAMFKWAKQPGRKFATVNPFADLPAPGGATIKRDRYLSPDEIRQVWRALDEPGRFNVSGDAATALRLILVTAARPGMVRGMVGSELRDLSGPSEHGPHWSLPGQRMKAGSAFITPLSGLALELLRPHLKTDPGAPMFDLHPNDLYEAAHRIVAATRDEPVDTARPAAHCGNDPRQGRLLARTDRSAARAHPKRRDGDLCAVGQVCPAARNGNGGRAGAARDAGRQASRNGGPNRRVKLRGGLQNKTGLPPYRTHRAFRVFTLHIRGWR